MSPTRFRVIQSLSEIKANHWDALANPANAPFDPFVSYAFLYALEVSKCIGKGTGWMPIYLIAEANSGEMVGAAPLYLKSHSQGEYVFDHGWAGAYEQAGGSYYPKLQNCIPFTPVTGRRILSHNPIVRIELITAMQELTARFGASSAHVTFPVETDAKALNQAGWLERLGLQFHFSNPGYSSYEDFLATLTSRKRKALRAERKKANKGVQIVALSQNDLQAEHWDAFYEFYQDTGARKWGQPYLNRHFFDLLHQNMRENILLILAKRDDRWIAGALNFIGGDCLYGRYWGCNEYQDSLHFELCYHQSIEQAILRGLSRVEAGAQGHHKIARGYLPAVTRSFHHLPDTGFSAAVQQFLLEEARSVEAEISACLELSPYRANN